jgi:hypothetical protein
MENDIIISYNKPYHQLIKKESFTNIFLYNKFLNWVTGEFDLFLQDESNNLKIFFPNAQLHIKKITQSSDPIIIEIYIKTNVLNYGFELINKISSLRNNLVKVYS